MFGHSSTNKDDARHLLGQDGMAEDEVVWEQHSVQSEAHTMGTSSEVWDQDPMSGENHELRKSSHANSQTPSSRSRPARSQRPIAIPEDHGEAATELDAEFDKIFNPVKKDQEERAKYHSDLDAACAAYSFRRDAMRERQRESEAAIEAPWLIARRRRDWQRTMSILRRLGVLWTCYGFGTVAHLEEIPPRIPWPPPHLTRMQEHHAEEAKALREAHIAVVLELRRKYVGEEGEADAREGHVCVERRALQEVLGEVPIPGDDFEE